MRFILPTLFLCSTPLIATSAVADEWTGEASLTGSNTTGNTETTDIGLGLKLNVAGDAWRHKFRASADFGEVSGTTNKERFSLGYQIERDFTDRLYGFARTDYLNDSFGAFTDSFFLGGGLGYDVITGGAVTWDLSGGAGFRTQTSALDVTEDEFALNAGSDFDWAINDKVSFYDDAGLIYADSNTSFFNEAGITAQLMGSLAGRVSFRVEHNTDVPAGTEKTDTITRFGIVYTLN